MRQEVHYGSGVKGTFQVKLETGAARCWICVSATVKEPGAEVPEYFLANHVTMESLQPGGNWLCLAYGPDDTNAIAEDVVVVPRHPGQGGVVEWEAGLIALPARDVCFEEGAGSRLRTPLLDDPE